MEKKVDLKKSFDVLSRAFFFPWLPVFSPWRSSADSPLHLAAMHGHPKVVKFLVEEGFNKAEGGSRRFF